jgi:hypothetical protein
MVYVDARATAFHVTLTVFPSVEVQADVTPVGAGGAPLASISPVLTPRPTGQLVLAAQTDPCANTAPRAPAKRRNRTRPDKEVRPPLDVGQLVQASVVGLVVEVAAPPVAVTPINAGIEKYEFSQADGDAVPMLPSFVMVTTRGLFACPLAPTVSVDVRVCDDPLVPLE